MNMAVKCLFSYLLVSDDRYNQDGHVHFAKDYGKSQASEMLHSARWKEHGSVPQHQQNSICELKLQSVMCPLYWMKTMESDVSIVVDEDNWQGLVMEINRRKCDHNVMLHLRPAKVRLILSQLCCVSCVSECVCKWMKHNTSHIAIRVNSMILLCIIQCECDYYMFVLKLIIMVSA